MSVFFLNMNIAQSPFIFVASCRHNIGTRTALHMALAHQLSVGRRRRGDHAGWRPSPKKPPGLGVPAEPFVTPARPT
jgi:hypothetical protein